MGVRVGIGLGTAASVGLDRGRFLAIVDACEHTGWDSLWFSELRGADLVSPLVAMAVVAGRTERLRFGTSVMLLTGRSPLVLAKEITSLDVLSGGRVIPVFGIGARGVGERDLVDIPRGQLGAWADETVDVVRRLWTGDPVTHLGRFHQLDDVTLRPAPVQRPLDLWFGGHSDAALERVARFGTGWLPSFLPPDRYAPLAAQLDTRATAHGRSIEADHRGVVVGYVPPGRGDEVAARVAQLARVRPELTVVDGSPDALGETIDAYVDAGASKFVLSPLADPGDWVAELARLRPVAAAAEAA